MLASRYIKDVEEAATNRILNADAKLKLISLK